MFWLRGRSPAAPSPAPASVAIAQAAQQLLPHLERGQRIDAAILRAAMETAFGASDASGAWDWRRPTTPARRRPSCSCANTARRYSAKPASPAAVLPMLAKIAGLLPTHTRRSEESQTFQQFSTPIPLGLAASIAAAITPADIVLEPSAGTGLLAIFAETRRRHARPQRAGRDPRRSARRTSFRPSPSPASTPRRSTITSMPASCRASC